RTVVADPLAAPARQGWGAGGADRRRRATAPLRPRPRPAPARRSVRRAPQHGRRVVPALRSRVTTHGRNAAGARSLWRATGMTDDDFGKPIVAIANSYTQFVPGHVHLKDLGEIVAEGVRAAGGVPREFHTIAVDDGIAMGHGGMLYSLPSRGVVSDAVGYMVNGETAVAR